MNELSEWKSEHTHTSLAARILRRAGNDPLRLDHIIYGITMCCLCVFPFQMVYGIAHLFFFFIPNSPLSLPWIPISILKTFSRCTPWRKPKKMGCGVPVVADRPSRAKLHTLKLSHLFFAIRPPSWSECVSTLANSPFSHPCRLVCRPFRITMAEEKGLGAISRSPACLSILSIPHIGTRGRLGIEFLGRPLSWSPNPRNHGNLALI